MIEIRPSLPGDCWLVLAALREPEVAELAALGVTSEECLRAGLMYGEAQTLVLNGEVAGMFGMSQCGEYNVPWAVFTKTIDANPLTFLRFCKQWREAQCGKMIQVVDARNEHALRWFRWMGFEIGEPQALGRSGELFHRVTVN